MPSTSTSALGRARVVRMRSSERAELWLKKRTSGCLPGCPAAMKVPSRMQACARLSRMSVVSLSARAMITPTMAW
jgi:hypothetical protein